MLSSSKFIRQSLELHLFFVRIMKEHSFFLEIGFTQRDSKYISQADVFRREFDSLLAEVISISNGVVSCDVLESGEVVTPFTLRAEKATAFYTGVKIPFDITKAESCLTCDSCIKNNHTILEQKVCMINNRAMKLVKELIKFKKIILSNVLCCKMFTNNYPLLIDHILREARLYLRLTKRLQNREEIDLEREAYEQETFWNRIMAEHAKFIRGLLDPTEEALINTANNFGNEFDELTKEAIEAMIMSTPISEITDESFKATQEIRNFKGQATQGLIRCRIKSIIVPLLGDHTLREASHYLRLLKIFKKDM